MLKSCVRVAAIASALIMSAQFIGAPANAADLPVKAPRYQSITPVPAMTWTGFYAGLNAGYGWADVGVAGDSNLSGILGGGQVGYNWQAGQTLFGVEADIQGTGESNSQTITEGTDTASINQNIPWFATVRGRIGFVNGPWLFYATGGAAWQRYKISATDGTDSVSATSTKLGWTAGGGIEWMFAPRWSLKAEYLYIRGGDAKVTLAGDTLSGKARNNIVRLGVNYHF